MTKALTLLIILLSLSFSALAQQSNSTGQAAGAQSRASLQKAYPGGRDDSDLTVQPRRKIAKKSEDIDLENFESGATEINGPQSEGSFGE